MYNILVDIKINKYNLIMSLKTVDNEIVFFDKTKLGNMLEDLICLLKDKTDKKDYIILFDILKKYANYDHVSEKIKNEINNIFYDKCTKTFNMEKILNDKYVYPNKEYETDIYIKRDKQFNFLKKIPQCEQRSKEWFSQRDGMITASDIGTAINLNHYEKRHSLILKKCDKGPGYKDNKYVHHGKKYEEIATMIYQFRYNVVVEEFGLIPHPLVPFIGASPDGICTKYTLDGKLSKLVGRMLEIKCPLTREIKLEGKIYNEICPAYYWAQVQIQLEVCELDECDFWQCRIEEYKNRDEFIQDTDPNNMYLSQEHGQEKGCLIQLLPKEKITEFCLYSAKYIYPPKINMSPKECDDWIFNEINKIWRTNSDYVFDKVIYWKLTRSKNVTIYRDIKWFNKVLPTIKETWDFISFYRKNELKLEELCDFIKKNCRKKNSSDIILNFISNQYNNIQFVSDDLLSEDSPKHNLMNNNNGDFLDTEDDSDNNSDNNIKNKKEKTNIFIKDKKGNQFYKSNKSDPECMLLSDSDE